MAGIAGAQPALRCYKKFHESLMDGHAAHPTFFFAAAAETMGPTSLGLAETAKFLPFDELGNPMSMTTMTYSNNLSYNLFARANRPLYEALYTGEGLPEELQGLTGQDLDYAIVSIEQTLVQSYIDNAIPERHRTRFINEATRGISISPASTVRKVVESYDGAFDFSNQNHREAIGRALVDKHRNEHFSVD